MDWAQVNSGGAHACALKTDGTLWCWGLDFHGLVGIADGGALDSTPVQLGTGTQWKQVSASNSDNQAAKWNLEALTKQQEKQEQEQDQKQKKDQKNQKGKKGKKDQKGQKGDQKQKGEQKGEPQEGEDGDQEEATHRARQ